MSFGYSVGDFIAIGQLTWSIYKNCKDAPGEFQELARQLSSLHTTIHELEDDVKTPTSLLNRRGIDRKSELETLLGNLSTTLGQVDDIVKRYHSLGTLQKKTWDRVKFATKDLADLRSKLQIHVTSIDLFMTSLSAGSLARIESLLDDLVRDIKAGRKETTILSAQDDNGELSWDELERELVGDGIKRDDVQFYRDDIRNYLRGLVDGVDDLVPSDSISVINNIQDLDVRDTDEDSIHTLTRIFPWISLSDVPGSHELIVSDPAVQRIPSNPSQVPRTNTIDTMISSNDPEPTHDLSLPSKQQFPTDSSIYHRCVESLLPAVASNPRLNLFQFNTEERQAIVFMATRREDEHKKFGIPYQPKAIAHAQAIVQKLAFGKRSFDYSIFPKLGDAEDNWGYRPCWQILFHRANSKPNSVLLNFQLAARIREVLKDCDVYHIEVKGGFRCRIFPRGLSSSYSSARR